MKITTIKIRRLQNSDTKMKGVCSITLDAQIAVHDIKVLQNNGKLFLAMPSRKTNSGTFKDIVHPINASIREKIEQLIFDLYKEMEKIDLTNQEFEYTANEHDSIIDQVSGCFKPTVQKSYSDYAEDKLRKALESWTGEQI